MIATAPCEQPLLCCSCQTMWGNPWGKLTPTLNYRLALTASLSAHQLANPPSHQPNQTVLPPLPLKTSPTCSSELFTSPSTQSPMNHCYLKAWCVWGSSAVFVCVLCSQNHFTLIIHDFMNLKQTCYAVLTVVNRVVIRLMKIITFKLCIMLKKE